jgi:hypothetical protein
VPFRWIVERTFAWLGRSRRLSKDYEGCTTSSEGFIYVDLNNVEEACRIGLNLALMNPTRDST